MQEGELLDKFTSTIARALLDVSEEPGWYLWPMPIFHPTEGNFYLYAPERSFVVDLFHHIKELEKRNLKDEEIARLFKNPSRIATLTFTFEGLRHSKLTKQQGIELAIKILRYIGRLRKDIFCEGKHNIIWTPEKVEKTLDQSPLIDLERVSKTQATQIRGRVGKINAGLWLLCEYLYFAHHSIGHEFHGPYQLANGKILVVRDYYDLQNEIWNFSKDFPFNQITSLEIYKGLEIHFDFFNRIRSTTQTPPFLTGICVRKGGVNGEIIELEELLSAISTIAREAGEYVKELGKAELLKKYVEAHYYIRKPLTDKLEVDWHPPVPVYDFIENVPPPKELMEAFRKMGSLPREQQIAGCKLIFDPRIEKLPF